MDLNGRSRRRLLSATLALVAAQLPLSPRSYAASTTVGEEWLELINTHTSEAVRVQVREGSRFIGSSLERLAHLLRDHRSQQSHHMDPRLYVLLTSLAIEAGVPARYEVISGYRSPASNALLRKRSNGVAQRSLHMEGRAIDVRLAGLPLARLRDLALARAIGGVGYYPRSDFVHLDTGRVRSWQG
jgi:uncharacterized protein YcbK (DUF882 family)